MEDNYNRLIFMKTEECRLEGQPKEIIRFFLNENGLVDVRIAAGYTLTEAAEQAVAAIKNVQYQ